MQYWSVFSLFQACPGLPDWPVGPGEQGAQEAGGDAVQEAVLRLRRPLLPADQQAAAVLLLPARGVQDLRLLAARRPGLVLRPLLPPQVSSAVTAATVCSDCSHGLQQLCSDCSDLSTLAHIISSGPWTAGVGRVWWQYPSVLAGPRADTALRDCTGGYGDQLTEDPLAVNIVHRSHCALFKHCHCIRHQKNKFLLVSSVSDLSVCGTSNLIKTSSIILWFSQNLLDRIFIFSVRYVAGD